MKIGHHLLSLSFSALLALTGSAIFPASASAMELSTLKITNVTTVKFNGLLQAWTVDNSVSTAKDQKIRLRRSEMKASGNLVENLKYFAMVDPAKLIPPPGGSSITADNMVQDFGMTLVTTPGLEITAGQFKIPTTAEGLLSSGDLPLPERSLVGRTFGDRREVGVKLAYKTQNWNASTMASNGRNIATKGTGAFNNVYARMEATPSQDLGLGTFMALDDKFGLDKAGRWGVNGRYNAGPVNLRAEFALGKTGPVRSQGLTTEVAYWFNESLGPVARYEVFNPNQAGNDRAIARTLGFNYLLKEYNAKIQMAGSSLKNLGAANGTPAFAKGLNERLITLSLQASI